MGVEANFLRPLYPPRVPNAEMRQPTPTQKHKLSVTQHKNTRKVEEEKQSPAFPCLTPPHPTSSQAPPPTHPPLKPPPPPLPPPPFPDLNALCSLIPCLPDEVSTTACQQVYNTRTSINRQRRGPRRQWPAICSQQPSSPGFRSLFYSVLKWNRQQKTRGLGRWEAMGGGGGSLT